MSGRLNIHRRRFCVGLMVALTACVLTPAMAAKPHPKIFGTHETRKKTLKIFKKWTDMLARYRLNLPLIGRRCVPGVDPNCMPRDWKAFLPSAKKLDRMGKIEAVNRFANQSPYVTDQVNWRASDYWSTPNQFFVKNGDCEDFAISKYLLLRQLGFKYTEMRIVVVKDLNLRLPHAVLAIYDGDRVLILDNQLQKIVDSRRIKHYHIMYSINEKHWWRHR